MGEIEAIDNQRAGKSRPDRADVYEPPRIALLGSLADLTIGGEFTEADSGTASNI